MLKTLGGKVRPEHTALLLVDLQNDFCHPEGFLGKRGRDRGLVNQMMPHLIDLLAEARKQGVTVIFIQYINSDSVMSPANLEQRARISDGKIELSCLEGSWGAEFYMISPRPGEAVVTKHRYNAFIGTDLDLILRSKGIKTLIMTGVATNVCVESTARDGFMRDYYIVFASDCSATTRAEEHEATLRSINDFFGVVATGEEIAAAWQ